MKTRPLILAALLGIALLTSGCAVGMLRGAASSGGSSAGNTSGSASSPGSRSAAQKAAADNAISTSVRSKLAASAVTKPFNLTVDTHDGIVTLRGQVSKVEQRNAAQAEARSVAGVKAVQNLITVR